MADILAVSEALAARIAPGLPGWNTFAFEPSPIPLPAYCVRPGVGDFADYEQVMGSYTVWMFVIGLYVNAIDQTAAHQRMAELTDPQGPVLGRLTSEDINDDLLRLCGTHVQPTRGRGWRVMRRNRDRYLYAEIGVKAGSN